MAKLTRISIGGVPITVNANYAPQFQGLLSDLAASGYDIGKDSGGYNYRTIAGTNKLSNHAFGNAIDVNWNRNARGTRGDIPAELARSLAKKHGLTWGGDWKNPDPMHFEVAGGSASHTHGADMPTYKDVGGQVPQMAPGSSPADVARAQQMAKFLMSQGQGTPKHWAEALGNAMSTLVGGLWAEQGSRGEKAGEQSANAALAQALMGGGTPDYGALMQNPRTRDIGVKMALAEREIARKQADPLYRARIEEAQANAALARSGAGAQAELMGAGQGMPPQAPVAPQPPQAAVPPPTEGAGRFANANILPPVTVEQPLMVEYAGQKFPLQKAQRLQAALAATKPKVAEALGKEIAKVTRLRDMEKLGLDPESAEGQVYLMTGKVPTKAYEKMANESKKAERGRNIVAGLEDINKMTTTYDDASFENALGPYQGAEPDSLAGAVPINIARGVGQVMNFFEGGKNTPSEVRASIAGATEALAAAIKPFIRAPGEGPWTDADQARLVAVVGNLPQASTKEEFKRRLNGVRDRVSANFGIDLPFDAFAGGKDTKDTTKNEGWRTVGGRRIREVR